MRGMPFCSTRCGGELDGIGLQAADWVMGFVTFVMVHASLAYTDGMPLPGSLHAYSGCQDRKKCKVGFLV